jgi:hypothetical protein
MARIRKAVVAGVGAGLTAAITLLASSGVPTNADEVGQLAGAFLAGALPVAWATWRIPNAERYR